MVRVELIIRSSSADWLTAPQRWPSWPSVLIWSVEMYGSFGFGDNCRKQQKTEKIQPPAPKSAVRKRRIALVPFSSPYSNPAATVPLPRHIMLRPALKINLWYFRRKTRLVSFLSPPASAMRIRTSDIRNYHNSLLVNKLIEWRCYR